MSAMLDLAAIKAYCEPASKGPWHQSRHSIERDYIFDPDNDPVAVAKTRRGNLNPFQRNEINAEFIAHAREDLPAVVAMIEAVLGFVEEHYKDGVCLSCGWRSGDGADHKGCWAGALDATLKQSGVV